MSEDGREIWRFLQDHNHCVRTIKRVSGLWTKSLNISFMLFRRTSSSMLDSGSPDHSRRIGSSATLLYCTYNTTSQKSGSSNLTLSTTPFSLPAAHSLDGGTSLLAHIARLSVVAAPVSQRINPGRCHMFTAATNDYACTSFSFNLCVF